MSFNLWVRWAKTCVEGKRYDTWLEMHAGSKCTTKRMNAQAPCYGESGLPGIFFLSPFDSHCPFMILFTPSSNVISRIDKNSYPLHNCYRLELLSIT